MKKYNLFFDYKSVFNTKAFLDVEENIKINHINHIRLLF